MVGEICRGGEINGEKLDGAEGIRGLGVSVWRCMGVVYSPVFLLSLRGVGWVCMMCLCSCLCLVLELV